VYSAIKLTLAAIGIGLIVLGLVVYSIGILFFLDRAMLAIGNVTFPLYLTAIDRLPDRSGDPCGPEGCSGLLRAAV